MTNRLQYTLFLLILSVPAVSGAQTAPAASQNAVACDAGGATAYRVSLRDRAQHIVNVQIAFRGEKGREFQMPVWNALYQVRDFAQYVRRVSAQGSEGKLDVQKMDKTTWRVEPAPGCSLLEYEIYANEPGPYNAHLDNEHAFFNWAQVLMYPTDRKKGVFTVELSDLPSGWKLRDGGLFKGNNTLVARAENYDRLVDSPVEIGTFEEVQFEECGGKYRVVVHADPADYDIQAITAMLRKVVATTVDWMAERPFEEYTFIYHFPRTPAGGGMEHAYSTAIDATAQRVRENPSSLASVSAHEFFHLWNVKRIRPQSLEAIDYTKENYTRALWFSEGVTSTVSDHMLYRAGLIGEKELLDRLAREIEQLHSRPGRLAQSLEESSLDTWFDKYAYYRQPERSINYYNKGQIVGELLDLHMRALTGGTKSLRDLFQAMNQDAKNGIFFQDSDGVQLAAEALVDESLDDFFEHYVSGTTEIPYENFFAFVGLRPVSRTTTEATLGFTASRNVGASPLVVSVEAGSEAQRAGIAANDTIMAIDGAAANTELLRKISAKKPGEVVRLKLRSRGKERAVNLKLGTRTTQRVQFVDLDNVTDEQRAHRAAWLRLESELPGSRR